MCLNYGKYHYGYTEYASLKISFLKWINRNTQEGNNVIYAIILLVDAYQTGRTH